MKKVWLSAMAVAAALAFVAVPSAVNPAPAHATAGWQYLTYDTGTVGYTYNYFNRLPIHSGGGNFMIKVTRNDGGGTIYGRIISRVSPYTIYGGTAENSNGEIIIYNIPAGDYDIELKTLSTPGYVVAEYWD